MNHFSRIQQALEYIDDHLDEKINFEQVANVFHFSPYYFHRIFSEIVGKTITVHIRDRRLEKACKLLADTTETVLAICLKCGFESSSSFCRVFKNKYGVSPNRYRKFRYVPSTTTVEEMIIRFTNRLKGGILVHPTIIKRNKLIIAGVSGDGNKTGEVWQKFMTLNKMIGFKNKLADNGYEIRLYTQDECECHVGFAVKNHDVDNSFTIMELPASGYASFNVYVTRGYDSENSAMNEWLKTNTDGYVQKLYDGKPYVVEYYDERFRGNQTDSIVEIWVPIEKNSKNLKQSIL